MPEASAVIVAARLNVPVVGNGAAARDAACGAFAVLPTTPDLKGPIDGLMSDALGYLGCFFTKGEPLVRAGDPAALDKALIEAVIRAEAAGAQCVIIGGGPLAEAATGNAEACPVPLIEPLPEACRRLQG